RAAKMRTAATFLLVWRWQPVKAAEKVGDKVEDKVTWSGTEPDQAPERFFRSEEFRRLFPESVVAWMEQHPRAPRTDEARQRELEYLRAGYHPLPEPQDLPVIVAVRMSLSF